MPQREVQLVVIGGHGLTLLQCSQKSLGYWLFPFQFPGVIQPARFHFPHYVTPGERSRDATTFSLAAAAVIRLLKSKSQIRFVSAWMYRQIGEAIRDPRRVQRCPDRRW